MKKTFAVHWQYGAATHTGWQRTTNEDRSLLHMGLTAKGTPYAAAVLADGMGGLADGGLAASIALERIKQWLDDRLPNLLARKDWWHAFEQGAEAQFTAIHNELHTCSQKQGKRLGTTLTLLLLIDHTYFIVHIGDCRVYRLTPERKLEKLTTDHSWVGKQVSWGLMSAETARKHPKRHLLLQFLGMPGKPHIEIRSGIYAPGSLFLLSSDGFHSSFSKDRIGEALNHYVQRRVKAQSICDELLSLTLEQRAADNISLLTVIPLDLRRSWDRWVWTGVRLAWHRLLHLRWPSFLHL